MDFTFGCSSAQNVIPPTSTGRVVSPANPELRPRKPRIRRLASLGSVLIFLGTAELLLRVLSPLGGDFYEGRQVDERTRAYGFGTITINQDGYPDQEWGPKERPRIGWLGDSVVYGTGAGDAHRFTEVLEELDPYHEHLNLGRPGYAGPRRGSERQTLALVRRLELDHLVYVLNLNDTEVAAPKEPAEKSEGLGEKLARYSALVDAITDPRFRKSSPQRPGICTGLFPSAHRARIWELAQDVERLARIMEQTGRRFSVVILPGEMQISAEAAAFYQSRGMLWEEGLLEGSAQDVLLSDLPLWVEAMDLRWAFLDPDDPQGSRERNPLCGHFVCTEGGSLDWNHLNRAGHRAVGEALAHSSIVACPHRPRPDDPGDCPAPQREFPPRERAVAGSSLP